jgi:cholesterol oxidase
MALPISGLDRYHEATLRSGALFLDAAFDHLGIGPFNLESVMSTITAFPPLFGHRRKLDLPPLEVVDFTAADGAALRLHHAPGGSRGAVVLAAGAAMTALSYCLDTTPRSLAEHLVGEGFDVWLFDWRTSPYLPAHKTPYSLDDVARNDWPAAVEAVRARTGQGRVSVLAHCLSSPSLFFSLVRGYLPPDHVDAIVASQVAFNFAMPTLGRLKALSELDKLVPEEQIIHMKPECATLGFADVIITALAALVCATCPCSSGVCHRHVATFGGLLQHDQVNDESHALMGELIPEVSAGFLDTVAPLCREPSALSADDERHLDRLALPITFLSGERNDTFLPESTLASERRLGEANGPGLYRRHLIPGYGHLDCLIGQRADQDVFPLISSALGPAVRALRAG